MPDQTPLREEVHFKIRNDHRNRLWRYASSCDSLIVFVYVHNILVVIKCTCAAEKAVAVEGLSIKINFFDTSGLEAYLEVRNEFYKDTNVVCVAMARNTARCNLPVSLMSGHPCM
jgi:hypothetical protein